MKTAPFGPLIWKSFAFSVAFLTAQILGESTGFSAISVGNAGNLCGFAE